MLQRRLISKETRPRLIWRELPIVRTLEKQRILVLVLDHGWLMPVCIYEWLWRKAQFTQFYAKGFLSFEAYCSSFTRPTSTAFHFHHSIGWHSNCFIFFYLCFHHQRREVVGRERGVGVSFHFTLQKRCVALRCMACFWSKSIYHSDWKGRPDQIMDGYST